MKTDHPTVEVLVCLCTFATFSSIAHKILDKVRMFSPCRHAVVLVA
jgi:hypothetical protein